MGLDMYLNKRTFVGANYEHRNVKGTIQLTEGEANKPIAIQLNRVSEITEQVAYWRKANHIHQWFVKNVQEGTDDCGSYYVSNKKLQQLIDDCNAVLKERHKAPEILATKSGFFFGGTDYDEYYFQDCEETVKMIEPLLAEPGEYYYHSSW